MADVKFTTEARALLKQLEACRLEAYQDEAGTWTIGWGHTGDVRPGRVITEHQADAVLDVDLQRFCAGVSHLLEHVPSLTSEQYSALVIFAFNVGLTGFMGSTALRDILAGHLDRVPGELSRWVYVHDRSGVPVISRILVARRKAEIALWNTPAEVA